MNWDAIGAVSELVGAAAVVASLVYVAVQIRQSTRAIKATAAKDTASTMRDWFSMIIPDPEMSRIFATGVEGTAGLTEAERVRFTLIMFNFLKALEEIHYQATHGLMDQDLWAGWHYQIAQYATAPGVQEYWAKRRLSFSRQFRAYVDSLEPDGSFKRVRDVAQEATSRTIPPAET